MIPFERSLLRLSRKDRQRFESNIARRRSSALIAARALTRCVKLLLSRANAREQESSSVQSSSANASALALPPRSRVQDRRERRGEVALRAARDNAARLQPDEGSWRDHL